MFVGHCNYQACFCDGFPNILYFRMAQKVKPRTSTSFKAESWLSEKGVAPCHFSQKANTYPVEQKGCHNSEATVIFLRNDWSRAARSEEERARTDDSKTRDDFRIGVHRTCTVLKVSPCSVQGPEMQMLRVQLQRGNKCFIYFSWSLCLWCHCPLPHLSLFPPSRVWTGYHEHLCRESGVRLCSGQRDWFGPVSLCCYISLPAGVPESLGWAAMSARGCSAFLTSVRCSGSGDSHPQPPLCPCPHLRGPWSPAGGSQGWCCHHRSCFDFSGAPWLLGGWK